MPQHLPIGCVECLGYHLMPVRSTPSSRAVDAVEIKGSDEGEGFGVGEQAEGEVGTGESDGCGSGLAVTR